MLLVDTENRLITVYPSLAYMVDEILIPIRGAGDYDLGNTRDYRRVLNYLQSETVYVPIVSEPDLVDINDRELREIASAIFKENEKRADRPPDGIAPS